MSERLAFPTSPERRLSDGLDFYKLTMGQLALAQHPDTDVTFTLKNRSESRLNQYVDPESLQARLDEIRDQGFANEEIEYYRSLQATDGTPRFGNEYLDYLADINLPEVAITTNETTGDFDIQTNGPWPAVSLWETVVMSELNQLYFEGKIKAEGLSLEAIYDEGDRRLTDKIEKLKERPDIKFSDFGTRRRFGNDWHNYVVGRLAAELPDNFVGTSNPWLAHAHDLTPIGTYAHEMPMVYAALQDKRTGDPMAGHSKMMRDWEQQYRGDLSIALTDTFTTEFFFEDFGEHGAKTWSGLRHDSGDPYEFGERAIAFYEQHGVDPIDKTLVFSDGLDIDTIISLTDYFENRVKLMFGWGTTLTNDLGLKANNFVMKATEADGVSTVKLSDVQGKHTGPDEQVARYVREKDARLAVDAVYATMVPA